MNITIRQCSKAEPHGTHDWTPEPRVINGPKRCPGVTTPAPQAHDVDWAALLAFLRCSDVHPERHDMGGVGTCEACKSWGAHVAEVIAAKVREEKARAWDEGFDAGERDVFEHEETGDWSSKCISNPYRAEGGSDE